MAESVLTDEVLYREKLVAEGKIAEIVLNRPEKGNALTIGMLDRIQALAQQIAQDNALMQAVDTALNSDDAAPARAYHLSDRSQRRQKARLDEN